MIDVTVSIDHGNNQSQENAFPWPAPYRGLHAGLYMPGMVAFKGNPAIKIFGERLQANELVPKVVSMLPCENLSIGSTAFVIMSAI